MSRILMAVDYKSTLQLPKTDFPMKADLPNREPKLLEKWKSEDLYHQILERRKEGKSFILHDGPPFANGDAHMGHALNMTLKDLVLKSKNMAGYHAPFIPGWDCHGLPIEHKVMKELGDQAKDPLTIRQNCEAYARKYIDIQRNQFERLGVLGEWQKPYLTMDPGYESDILRTFATIVEKGWVYQALRPVYWSTGCQTALAEAEIEYAPKMDLSVFVRFSILDASLSKIGITEPVSILIWTTTPWTLPANLGVAVGPGMSYGLYRQNGESFLASTILASKLPGFEAGEPVKVFKGSELEGIQYQHPFLDRQGQIYSADFVTTDAGTGFVHVAPGHGRDDYQLGQRVGLQTLSPVDDRGCLTEECGVADLVGKYVFKANPVVRDILREKGKLWADQEFSHDYPHCWRSKTPIIFRSVSQWFIDVNAFRAEALEEIKTVSWVPAWGENRIRGAVESRPDWCISRQRTWGVPLPVFYDDRGTAVLTAEQVRKVADIVEKNGTDWWFKTDANEIAQTLGLPLGLRKGLDTLDVWIDSGASHTAVVKRRLSFPADLYLEGSDQHRGWFQSSLLTSVAVCGKAPYRQVLTNGFVVDVDGKKLSKSATYQKPTDLITFVNKFGADILRLWVASQDYRDDVPFSEEIFTRVTDSYRSVRNTLRILLGNLAGFTPDKAVDRSEWTEIDLYVDGQLQDLIRSVRASYESYEFHAVYHAVNRFCSVDLSAFYVDVLKDRMYCDSVTGKRRLAAQTVMHRVVESLVKLIAPVTPFTAEETWLMLGNSESVHLQLFPEAGEGAAQFRERWDRMIQIRSVVNEHLEKARQQKIIGKSLEAQVILKGSGLTDLDRELLQEILIVSKVTLESGETLSAEVAPAQGNALDAQIPALPA
ncbi:MAG: isoleucine--tRNA ligase, partial [Verrucomicrobiota bacterium]